MTADADARLRAVYAVPRPVAADHIACVAVATGVEGVDRMLDGRGPAPDVLQRRTRVPVRARAHCVGYETRDERVTNTNQVVARRRGNRGSGRTGATTTGQLGGCGVDAPAAESTPLAAALHSNARVCSDLRLVALWWTWSSSGSVRSTVAGGR